MRTTLMAVLLTAACAPDDMGEPDAARPFADAGRCATVVCRAGQTCREREDGVATCDPPCGGLGEACCEVVDVVGRVVGLECRGDLGCAFYSGVVHGRLTCE